MDKQQRIEKLRTWINIVTPLLFLPLLSGCRAQREVQTEYVYLNRTDTVSAVKWRVDSVAVRDSIAVYISGDTVQIDRWHNVYRDRLRVDTVEKVVIAQQEIKAYEAIYPSGPSSQGLRWWQTALMWIGGISFLFFAGWCLYRYRR